MPKIDDNEDEKKATNGKKRVKREDSPDNEEETWYSPPKNKQNGISKAKIARSLSLSKQQSTKILRVDLHDSEKDVTFVSEEQPDLEERIRRSHYRYHFSKFSFLDKLHYLHMLQEEDRVRVIRQASHDFDGVFFTLEKDEPLYFQSFLQLLQKSPLSSDVVDVCLYDLNSRFGNLASHVFSYTEGHFLINEPLTRDSPNMLNTIGTCDILFIPVKSPRHWALAVVYPAEMEYQLLDPAGVDKRMEQQIGERLNTYFHHFKVKMENNFSLATRFLEFQKQDNNYDCAILMIYYVESILRRGKCTTVDTATYRVELAERFVEMSRKKMNESISMQRERAMLGCETYENGLIISNG